MRYGKEGRTFGIVGGVSLPLYRLSELLGVRRCLFCRLPIGKDGWLCEACEEAFDEEKRWECGACGSLLSECECSSPYLSTHGVRRLIKLYRYRPDTDARVNLLLFRLKRQDYRAIRLFLADELASSVRRVIEKGKGEYLLTYVPRTASARRRYGFDQSKELAQALSERLSLPYETLLCRSDAARKQKRLRSRAERIQNARESFLPATSASLTGRHILLLDDTVTTGASLAACAYVLRKMGAREVIGVSPFVSFRHKNLRIEQEQNSRLEKYYKSK